MYMQNINPLIWGEHGWRFMHYVTLSYPEKPTEEDKENIKQFFNYVGKVLPCVSCRENYKMHNKMHPLDDEALKSRRNLVTWLLNIHNSVNKLHGKRTYTLDELYKEYMTPKNGCSFNLSILLLLVLLLILVIIIIFRNCNNIKLIS